MALHYVPPLSAAPGLWPRMDLLLQFRNVRVSPSVSQSLTHSCSTGFCFLPPWVVRYVGRDLAMWSGLVTQNRLIVVLAVAVGVMIVRQHVRMNY